MDTIKVKMQRMAAPLPGQPPLYTGAMDALRKAVAAEGVLGLYAGIQAPLPFVALFNATLFTVNTGMRGIVGGGRSDSDLSIPEIGASAVGAGAAVAFIACPTELVKCRLQAEPGVHAGAIDVTRKVFAAKGIPGLFRGMGATLAREIPGNSLYFMSYVGMQRAFTPPGGSPKDLGLDKLLFAGGMAGVAFWLPCYPIDAAKTRLQTDSVMNPQYRGLVDCIRKVVRTEGVGALYRGVGPCLFRAFPANAATFVTYEWVKGLLPS